MSARGKLFTIRVNEAELSAMYADAAAFGDTAARWTRRCWDFGRSSLRPGVVQVAQPVVGAHSGAKHGPNGGKPAKKGTRKNGKASKKSRARSR